MDEESRLTYDKFNSDVLSLSAEACLPANLSDEWIHFLDDELGSVITWGDVENLKQNVPFILKLVVKIINAKNGGGSLFTAVLDELFTKTGEYQREIALEIFRRRSKIDCEPATLDNIFTKRTIGCWKI